MSYRLRRGQACGNYRAAEVTRLLYKNTELTVARFQDIRPDGFNLVPLQTASHRTLPANRRVGNRRDAYHRRCHRSTGETQPGGSICALSATGDERESRLRDADRPWLQPSQATVCLVEACKLESGHRPINPAIARSTTTSTRHQVSIIEVRIDVVVAFHRLWKR